MSESELSRLRQDVNAIQEAAGLTLSFGWPEVWLCLALAPCGLITSLWAALGPMDYFFVSFVPYVFLVLAAVAFQVSQYRRIGMNRSMSFGWVFIGVVTVGFILLFLWQKWLDLPVKPVYGAAFIIAGFMFFVISLVDRQGRACMAVFAGMVPFGIILPLCSQQQVIYVVGGIAEIVVGTVAAGILAWQLRAERNICERVTN